MTPRILVVDDEAPTRQLIRVVLEKQDFEMLEASTGEEALAILAEEQPDLLLLDIMMPDMDGYDVTRQVRANPATADLPIILFSARSMVDDKVVGFEAGADDYLTKPLHPAELTARIRALLAKKDDDE